jgi:hypothetical protein
MVVDIVEAMGAEQGAMLIHDPESVPVTQLGSRLIKMWAARDADHPEYQDTWALDTLRSSEQGASPSPRRWRDR